MTAEVLENHNMSGVHLLSQELSSCSRKEGALSRFRKVSRLDSDDVRFHVNSRNSESDVILMLGH